VKYIGIRCIVCCGEEGERIIPPKLWANIESIPLNYNYVDTCVWCGTKFYREIEETDNGHN